MNGDLLLLYKKHTDTLIEQPKTKPQETLDFQLNKQLQNFFTFTVNKLDCKESKWLLGVVSFEATNCVFIIIEENNSFSNSIPGPWRFLNFLEDGIIDKLKNLLNHRSQIDIELHVKEVKRRGNQIGIGGEEYTLSDLDSSRKEIFEEIKSAINHVLEISVYRMGLTYDENVDVLHINFLRSERIDYIRPHGIHEISDSNRTLEYLLPTFVKVKTTIDDNKLKSKIRNNQTLILTKR